VKPPTNPIRRALRLLSTLLLFAVLIAPTPSAGQLRAADTPSLGDILVRAGNYVHQFQQDFSLVISEEDGVQNYDPRPGFQTGAWTQPITSSPGQATERVNRITDPHEARRRQIRSEMLVVRQGGWLAVRNVLWIRDNDATRTEVLADSKGRLDRLLKDTSAGQASRLRALAEESARFNLGRLYRNFNVPTLALQFLAPEFQGRFAFTVAGSEKVSGSPTVKVAFAERQPPTVITLNDKREVLSTGFLWVRESDGAVVRTRLAIKAPQTEDGAGIEASVDVDYRYETKLNMWVPRRMEEKYAEAATGGERVDCLSTYSNYRRFETSGRLVSPQ
jgi:hypothetical protein